MLDLDIGDIVWAELDPVVGTEQAKRRPALVLTSLDYHRRSPRAVICPITSTGSAWPFNLPLPPDLKTRGAIQIDQIRTLHREGRLFQLVERVPAEFLHSVRARVAGLLGIDVHLKPNLL